MKMLFDGLAIATLAFVIVIISVDAPAGMSAVWTYIILTTCFLWLHRGNV